MKKLTLKFPSKSVKSAPSPTPIAERYLGQIPITNNFLPDEIDKHCPVSSKMYNLFESRLPATGHYALLIATALASMHVDEAKPSSVSIGARPTEGKTVVLSNFSALNDINYFTRTSFAMYVLRYCGKYFDIERPYTGVKELPLGVTKQRDKQTGKYKYSNKNAKEYIDYHFDLVHAGEGIFTMSDYSKLMQLWNGLLDEGYWAGGDCHKGWYDIGSPQFRRRHGLILACTLHDLQHEWAKQIGTMSRTIVAYYHCTDKENQYIIEGRAPPKIHITYESFSEDVRNILSHLQHKGLKVIKFKDEVNSKLTNNIIKLIMSGRSEGTGKRAMNDRINMLKGHARLNNRKTVTFYDAIMVESILQMCRRIKNKKTDYLYGSRLSFQCQLRSLLWGNFERTRKDIRKTFTWWNSDESLYSNPEIVDTIDKINSPILGKAQLKVVDRAPSPLDFT